MQGSLFADTSNDGALVDLRERAMRCTSCKLQWTRRSVVFGEGNANRPNVCFVGEGPGANEDMDGRPFVGKAGQLLDKMIEAMKLTREQVYICNTVCCRPPDNRTPEPEEMIACRPFLLGQLHLVQPRIIVALGQTAATALTKKAKPVSKLRGGWHEYGSTPLKVSFHPAYLLRNPQEKARAWQDMQEVIKKLGELGAALPKTADQPKAY